MGILTKILFVCGWIFLGLKMRTKTDHKDRLKQCPTKEDQWRLLYMWVKQGVISRGEFTELAMDMPVIDHAVTGGYGQLYPWEDY